MAEAKFKKGDILKPSKKGVSNYWGLINIVELEVLNKDINSSWSKKLLRLKIKKGSTSNTMTYCSAFNGDTIDIYEDALELFIAPEQDYDIF
jgi:hypothetical protein